MTLPKIVRPRYDIDVPGYGPVHVSPFTVADKKVLLSAVAFNDANAFINAVVDIVGSCSDVKPDDMALHFIEYIFLQIYAKSTGGVITGTYTCSGIFTPPPKPPVPFEVKEGEVAPEPVELPPPEPEICGFEMPVNIPIDMAVIDYGSIGQGDFNVDVGDVIITFAVPPWKAMKDFVATGKSVVDLGEDFVIECIKSISSAEGTFTKTDYSKEELVKWLEDLPSDAGDKIAPFFSSLPVVSEVIPITCPKCKTKRSIELKGLDDFFV